MIWQDFQLPAQVQPEEEGHSSTFARFLAQPFEHGWKIVGKAARGIVAHVTGPRELFNINLLRTHLNDTVQRLDLPPTTTCQRCGQPINGIQIFTADIDQAFEACSSS